MDKDHDGFAAPVAAINPLAAVTITCGLGERRQIQIALNISCDHPPEVQDAMLDQAMRRLDRQQARYDLEKLEENFQLVGLNTRNAILALDSAGATLKAQIERLKAELAGKEEGRKAIHDEAYAEWTKSGRRGAFNPKGSVLQKLNLADADIRKTKEAIEAAPRDAEQERAKIVGGVQRGQEDLRLRRRQINDLRKLAGLDPTTEFEDVENAKV